MQYRNKLEATAILDFVLGVLIPVGTGLGLEPGGPQCCIFEKHRQQNLVTNYILQLNSILACRFEFASSIQRCSQIFVKYVRPPLPQPAPPIENIESRRSEAVSSYL